MGYSLPPSIFRAEQRPKGLASHSLRDGFAFVRAEHNAERSLVVRDAQHETE